VWGERVTDGDETTIEGTCKKGEKMKRLTDEDDGEADEMNRVSSIV